MTDCVVFTLRCRQRSDINRPADQRSGVSAIGMIDQLLQPTSELRRKPRQPVLIDQLDVQHVSKMHPVLITKRRQLHPHQRFQSEDSKRVRILELVNVRSWQQILIPGFFLANTTCIASRAFASGPSRNLSIPAERRCTKPRCFIAVIAAGRSSRRSRISTSRVVRTAASSA